MTKKSGFALILLMILTVGIIWFGMDHQKTQKAKLLRTNDTTAVSSDKAANNKTSSKAQKADLAAQQEKFENNREQLSVSDYLAHLSAKEEKAVVSFYGDFSESETWLSVVEKYITKQINSDIEVHQLAFPDYDSYRLLEENTMTAVAETKPDVVFFQVPVYGDQVRDISLADSGEYVAEDYAAIKQALPEALVVLVTPNPSSSRQGEFNSRTLDYTSYLAQAVKVAEENEFPLFDLHAAFQSEMETQEQDLSAVLKEDGRALNDQGTDLYASLFTEQLTEPIDTTSGR